MVAKAIWNCKNLSTRTRRGLITFSGVNFCCIYFLSTAFTPSVHLHRKKRCIRIIVVRFLFVCNFNRLSPYKYRVLTNLKLLNNFVMFIQFHVLKCLWFSCHSPPVYIHLYINLFLFLHAKRILVLVYSSFYGFIKSLKFFLLPQPCFKHFVWSFFSLFSF